MHVPGVKYGKILFSPFSLFHVSVRSRMRHHNFATVSAKNKVKISSYSAYFELQNGIKNAITQKCGEWVVYACTVTYIYIYMLKDYNIYTYIYTKGLFIGLFF